MPYLNRQKTEIKLNYNSQFQSLKKGRAGAETEK